MADDRPFAGAPAELQATMARIGPIWGQDIRKHSALVKEAYRPLLARSPKAGVEVLRDLAYGAHPRQVLDVFRPLEEAAGGMGRPGAACPVAVFVHGGAFIRGDKRSDEEIYDNVLYWFARSGFLGINVEYRLAPEACYPAGAGDVAAAVDWVRRYASDYGGDPKRIFLIGHSAGGTHVATYAFDPAAGYFGRDVAGAVLISARLRADSLPENPNAAGVMAYFGKDSERYEHCSPLVHCGVGELPLFIVIAEYENPLLDVYGLEMAYRWSLARRRAPRFLQMSGHNHMSIMAHFNTADDFLGRQIVDFCRSVPA